MATPGPAVPDDFTQWKKMVERRLRELSALAGRRPRLAVTEGDFEVTGGGGIRVRDGGFLNVEYPEGGASVRAGDIRNEADGSYQGTGLLIQDHEGNDIAQFRTDVDEDAYAVIRDGNGDIVFRTDPSGGLQNPRLSYPLYKYGPQAENSFESSSGSFETAFMGFAYTYHKKIEVGVLTWAGNGNEGDVRLLVNDQTLGNAEHFSTSEFITWAQNIPGDYTPGQHTRIEIQIRRTAGTGTVAVQPTWCQAGWTSSG